MRRPSENVLDKICNLPNGKAYRSVLNFSEEGINADVSVGDIKGKRFFERIQ